MDARNEKKSDIDQAKLTLNPFACPARKPQVPANSGVAVISSSVRSNVAFRPSESSAPYRFVRGPIGAIRKNYSLAGMILLY
jgi:hypothetical protein